MSLANKIIQIQESGCEESLAPVHGLSVTDIMDEMLERTEFGFILAQAVVSEDWDRYAKASQELMEAACTSLIERRRADRG